MLPLPPLGLAPCETEICLCRIQKKFPCLKFLLRLFSLFFSLPPVMNWSTIPIDWLVLCLQYLSLSDLAACSASAVSRSFRDAIREIDLQPLDVAWECTDHVLPEGIVLAPAPIFVTHVVAVWLTFNTRSTSYLTHIALLRVLPNLERLIIKGRDLISQWDSTQDLWSESMDAWKDAARGMTSLNHVTLDVTDDHHLNGLVHAIVTHVPSLTSLSLVQPCCFLNEVYEFVNTLETLHTIELVWPAYNRQYPQSINVLHVKNVSLTVPHLLTPVHEMFKEMVFGLSTCHWRTLSCSINQYYLHDESLFTGLSPTSFPCLDTLTLDLNHGQESLKATIVPILPWLHLFPALRHLTLACVPSHMNLLVWAGGGSLETLKLEECCVASLRDMAHHMPRLSSLTLEDCTFKDDDVTTTIDHVIQYQLPRLQHLVVKFYLCPRNARNTNIALACSRVCKARQPNVSFNCKEYDE
jgi:hypothetical protein